MDTAYAMNKDRQIMCKSHFETFDNVTVKGIVERSNTSLCHSEMGVLSKLCTNYELEFIGFHCSSNNEAFSDYQIVQYFYLHNN